jgi:hypothetical protein
MTRAKKIRNKSITKKNVAIGLKYMPEGHRYDEEIATICSNLLLRLEIARIKGPISKEKEAKTYLRQVISKNRMSNVALKYFNGILTLSAKNPLSQIVSPMIESTYEEHNFVKKHLRKFSNLSMKDRFNNLMVKLKENKWTIVDGDITKEGLEKIIGNAIVLHTGIEEDFSEDGNVNKGFSVVGIIVNNNEFVRHAYSEGLIFFKKAYSKGYFLLHLFPDNNIPGASFMPEKYKE